MIVTTFGHSPLSTLTPAIPGDPQRLLRAGVAAELRQLRVDPLDLVHELLRGVAHLVLPVARAHDAAQVLRHDRLLVLLDPGLRCHGLYGGQHQVVPEGEGADQLGEQQPEQREPAQAVGEADLGHGVADPQGEDVAEDIELGVASVELRGSVIASQPWEEKVTGAGFKEGISLGNHVVGVLEDLEDVAEGEAEREATEVVPVAGELEVVVDDSVSDLLQYLGLQGEGRLQASGAAPPPPEQVG